MPFSLRSSLIIPTIFVALTAFADAPSLGGQALQRVGVISTIAGSGATGGSGCSGTGLTATSSGLHSPVAATGDASGNLYLLDGNCVLKQTPSGVLTTLAGMVSAGFAGDGGPAIDAQFNSPSALAVDAAGNLFIADTGNNRIRRISAADGRIATIAGSGGAGVAGSFCGDQTAATSACLNQPKGVAVDPSGEVFIADTNNQRIREISTSGVIVTIAGNGTAGFNGDESGGITVQSVNQELNFPEGIVLIGENEMYIADSGNNRVRRLNYFNGNVTINGVQYSGAMYTAAGTGGYGSAGDFGAATSALLRTPNDVAYRPGVDGFWIADASHRVRFVNTDSGTIYTVAGTGAQGFSGDGQPAPSAQIGVLNGIGIDAAGGLIIADHDNLRVRLVTTPEDLFFANTALGSGSVAQSIYLETTSANQTIGSLGVAPAPNGKSDYTLGAVSGCSVGNGTPNSAGTICVISVTFTPALPGRRNEPLIASTSTGTSSVGLAGVGVGAQADFMPPVTRVVAGNGTAGDSGDGGPAASASLNAPTALWSNPDGSVLIADSGNNSVRRIAPDGTIATVNGTSGTSVGMSGVAEDAQGNIYFSSNGISVVDADSNAVSHYAGGSPTAGTVNGVDADYASLQDAGSLAFDASGNLYVALPAQNLVRRIDAGTHLIYTVAGTGAANSSGDGGQAAAAAINKPSAITIDTAGNLYVAEQAGNRIRKVVLSTGIISTVAGSGGAVDSGDGGVAISGNVAAPSGLSVDAAGNLYVTTASSLRLITAADGGISTIPGVNFVSPCCSTVDGQGNIYTSDSNVVYKTASGTPPSLTFATTNLNAISSDSPKLATVLNTGNATLSFPAPGSGFNPVISSEFSFATSGNGQCGHTPAGGAALQLPQGASCTLPISFMPTTAGIISGSLVLNDTSDTSGVSFSSQSIPLNGAGIDGLTKFTVTGLVNATSGYVQTVTVTAVNQTNGTDSSYAGAVHFTSSDRSASLPADYTFTDSDAGQHTFNLTLRAIGVELVTVVDQSNTSNTGTESATISAPKVTVTGLVAGSSGQQQTATVQITTASGGAIPGFTGDVAFSSSDSAATLPANYTFTAADAGSHSFYLELRTPGNSSVTATYTPVPSATGAQSVPIAATHFGVTGLASGTAGTPQAFKVQVLTVAGAVLSNYVGTVTFSSTDAAAVLPPNFAFTAANAGSANFTLTPGTQGSQTATVSDVEVPSENGSESFSVSPQPYTLSLISGSGQGASIGAGFASPLRVIARDQSGNAAAGVLVTYAVPASGSSAVATNTNVSTASDGTGGITATANGLAGSYTVTASSSSSSTSVSFTLTNNKSAEGLSLAAQPQGTSSGQNVLLTATLAPVSVAGSTPSGSVSFYDGGTFLASTAVSGGKAGYTQPVPALGTHNYTATYSGDNNFSSASGTASAMTTSNNVTVTISNTSQTYDGSVKPVTVSSSPSFPITVTYNGSSTVPANAGSYNVVATVSSGAFKGMSTATLLIAQRPATIFGSSKFTSFNGYPQALTYNSTYPTGLAVTFTYNGSTSAPTYGGNYMVVGMVNDPNYTDTQNFALYINPASTTATTSVNGADFTYGQPAMLSFKLSPDPIATTYATGYVDFYDASTGLEVNNGALLTPTGAYQTYYAPAGTHVINAVSGGDQNFNGANGGNVTFNVSKAATSLTTVAQPLQCTYGSCATIPITVNGQFSNANIQGPTGPVNYSISGGPTQTAATGNGNALLVVPANQTPGTYSVTVTYPGDANYTGSSLPIALMVSKAAATVTLGGFSATYNGSAHPAVANTSPSGLAVALTYNGSATAPATVGSYAVVATITDPDYSGSGTGTLTITQASATVTLSSLAATYDGNPHFATATTSPSGLGVSLTYNGSSTPPSAQGSYAVAATVTDSNYKGSASGTLMIAKGAATVTLGNLAAMFDGTPHEATATTSPAGLTVTFTYNGSTTAPSAVGQYAVVGSISSAGYTGSSTGTLVISKNTATVVLGNLSATYDGTPHAASAMTNPSNVAVTLTYNGSSTAPTIAGTYSVVGTITDPKYSGTATGTLIIGKGTATVTLGSLSASLDGNSHSATATTTPSGLSVGFTYNGSATPPSAKGSYTVLATVSDLNYTGSATGTLVIGTASATVSLGSLNTTYNGSSHAATATTNPAGLTVAFTYNGAPTAPTAAGNYTVVGTVSDPSYTGSASATLAIAPAAGSITLSGLSATYNGSAHAVTATTSPGGLAVNLTYNGVGTVPSSAGSYTVVATLSDPNYTGSATATLVITKALANLMLGSLSAVYNGNSHAATAVSNPVGLAVIFTYNGSITAPSAKGSYSVAGTVNDPNYSGSALGTLMISNANAAVTLGSLLATYDGNPHAATASTTPSGLAVSFTYNGFATIPVAAGSYAVSATINDANYTGSSTGTLAIAKASAGIALNNLSASYDGNPHAISATTTPTGLGVTITYNGSASAPFANGSYTVLAVINDANYMGVVTGTLTITSANASVTLANLSATYDGAPHAATASTIPAGLAVTLTYNGSANVPTMAGSYSVVGTINDSHYNGLGSGTLVIAKANAGVTLSGLSATYDGNPHGVMATTTPGGLAVMLTYNGSATLPSAVGSYTVIATINDSNYTGSAMGTLLIGRTAATLTLGTLTAAYNGSTHAATATTSPAGLAVSVTYNGSASAPTAAGSYMVLGTITDPNYSGSASGTLVIQKAQAALTLNTLSATYDGNPHAATAATTPGGLSVSLTYNGSTLIPAAVGSYAIVGTISDNNYSGFATGTLVITKGTATVSLGSLSAAYNGSPHSATATTTPGGLTILLTYNGSASSPSAVGSYAVVGTVNDPNYTGSAMGTLTISNSNAIITLSGLNTIYTGSPQAVAATTSPAGLAVTLTYNGAITAPTMVGKYSVVGTIDDPSYSGSAAGTLVISNANATITLDGLAATYDGNPHAATATTVPGGLAVGFTYNGSAKIPRSAGSYSVVATINDPNYTGTTTGSLIVRSGLATVKLENLTSTYNGSAQAITTTTTPAGLSVSLTYNGSVNAPVNAGNYIVVGTINDPDYAGTASGTLTVVKATSAITLSNLSALYDGSSHPATAVTAPAGLSVQVTYNGSSAAPTAVGAYTVVASVKDPNYAGSATGTLTISNGSATIILGGLNATYTGSPLAVTPTTTPAGLIVRVTYNGVTAAPTAVGSYAVVATIQDPNYSGSISGTLVIGKAKAAVMLGNLAATYNGSPHAASATTAPAGLAVVFTYDASATVPMAAGTYAVVGTIQDPSYDGSASGTLVLSKADAGVKLSNLSATYDGNSHVATVDTTPSGLMVNLTYNGSPVAPTSSGSYIVAATVSDLNYAGAARGTLIVVKATAGVTLGNLNAVYDGRSKSIPAATTPVGLNLSFSYNGFATPPITAGNYAVVATVMDANYSGVATGTFVLFKAQTTSVLTTPGSPVNPGQSVTLTVAVATAATTQPTGSVAFSDNGTPLGTSVLVNGVASDTLILSPGATHAITASYAGDLNFASSASNSGSIKVLPLSFTFLGAGSLDQTVLAGETATYTFSLSPFANSPYPGQVSFGVDGLPRGAVASFSPTRVAADAGGQSVTLTVKTSDNINDSIASAGGLQRRLVFSTLFLLPLLVGRRWRRRVRSTPLALVLLAVSLFTFTGLTGCGSGVHAGFRHDLVVTATSGTVQRSATVSITVR